MRNKSGTFESDVRPGLIGKEALFTGADLFEIDPLRDDAEVKVRLRDGFVLDAQTLYIGDNWRFVVTSTDLVVERLVGSSWVQVTVFGGS